MGALTYRPAWNVHQETSLSDLDDLSEECWALLNREEVSDLDALFQMGGSSGGRAPRSWLTNGSSSSPHRATCLRQG